TPPMGVRSTVWLRWAMSRESCRQRSMCTAFCNERKRPAPNNLEADALTRRRTGGATDQEERAMSTNDDVLQDQSHPCVVDWAPDETRGARTVLGRSLTENAHVPLFFAQSLIQSRRDVGYNNTPSALCDHVDNAIQAGATEIRVYFRQTVKRG